MMVEPKLRFKADDGSDFPDWEEEMLGELVEIQRGGSPRPISKFITTGEGINWIKIGDAPSHGNCITKVKERIIPEGKAKSREVHKGDLLLSNSMSFGRPYILGVDGCIHDGWLVVHDTNAVFETEFLCEYLGTESVFRQYKRLAAGSAVNNLNKDLVSSVVLGVPSLPEQRKIADLLSAVDDVITAQEVEVATWEKRKKGVMQKLFSQEVRFKADDGSNFPDWEEKTLGNMGAFLKGAPLSKSDITDEGTPLILYGELYTTYAEVAYSIARRTDKKVSDKFYSKVGDVVIPTSGETPEEISTATCVMKDGVILAGDLYIYRPATNVDGRILSYLLNHQVNNAISRIAQGKSVVHVQSKELERIHVIFPSSPIEQRKIADCLASLDDVIAKAKGELDAWRELKKGLLQQMFV